MKKISVLMAVGLIALAGFSSNAGATITFNLNIGNVGLAGYAGPYARVDVTRTSATTAHIEFISLVVSGNMYRFGDGSSVAVNVNASSWNVILGPTSAVSGGTGFSLATPTDAGSGTVDGHGIFNQRLDSFDGFQYSSGAIRFDLTNNSGTWGSDSDVLVANADGHRAAAHIFVTSWPAVASNGAFVTGFATDGPPTVPEPTSMLLLGLGLAGAGVVRRRRKS